MNKLVIALIACLVVSVAVATAPDQQGTNEPKRPGSDDFNGGKGWTTASISVGKSALESFADDSVSEGPLKLVEKKKNPCANQTSEVGCETCCNNQGKQHNFTRTAVIGKIWGIKKLVSYCSCLDTNRYNHADR